MSFRCGRIRDCNGGVLVHEHCQIPGVRGITFRFQGEQCTLAVDGAVPVIDRHSIQWSIRRRDAYWASIPPRVLKPFGRGLIWAISGMAS